MKLWKNKLIKKTYKIKKKSTKKMKIKFNRKKKTQGWWNWKKNDYK
jgi:hypothetical protein